MVLAVFGVITIALVITITLVFTIALVVMMVVMVLALMMTMTVLLMLIAGATFMLFGVFKAFVHGFHPAGRVENGIEIIAVCVEQLTQCNISLGCFNNGCALLQAVYNCAQFSHLFGAYLVGLVHDEGGTKLNLVNNQVCNIVFFVVLFHKCLTAVELVKHTSAVYYSNNVVKFNMNR